jgi:hypothetical protein
MSEQSAMTLRGLKDVVVDRTWDRLDHIRESHGLQLFCEIFTCIEILVTPLPEHDVDVIDAAKIRVFFADIAIYELTREQFDLRRKLLTGLGSFEQADLAEA